ncbi:MAG: gliding motility-associated C-terminal domain-containing protein, partial [Bacteroidota bacterium]
GEFDPNVAGVGIHVLVYNANTCIDSMRVQVHPEINLTDTIACVLTDPFFLSTDQPGGTWSGSGIINADSGKYAPSVAGLGIHLIEYTAPSGCVDTMQVEVTPPPNPIINNLAGQYCYKDTIYVLDGQPAGGYFIGPGIVGTNGFNPSLAGAGGPHVIDYIVGVGDCERIATGVTEVSPPLELSVAFTQDTICYGDYSRLEAFGSGGTGAIVYTWTRGLGGGSDHSVSPEVTTRYKVTVSDGCSDPVSELIQVVVNPQFILNFSSSDPVCFGERGWTAVDVQGPNVYDIIWNTNPPTFGDTLRGPTDFNLEAVVTDLITGCVESGLSEIPRYPYVQAEFISNPNDQCLVNTEPEFSFIDQSVGGTSGLWDFGDGFQQPYEYGQEVFHKYAAVGNYQVSLFIENDGGCSDSTSTEVCVIPEESVVWAPNAFTPNGDDVNDAFFIAHTGIETFRMQIYDRWGRIVFEADQPDARWDGTLNGSPVPEGVYTFLISGSIRSNNPLIDFAIVPLQQKGTITLYR